MFFFPSNLGKFRNSENESRKKTIRFPPTRFNSTEIFIRSLDSNLMTINDIKPRFQLTIRQLAFWDSAATEIEAATHS